MTFAAKAPPCPANEYAQVWAATQVLRASLEYDEWRFNLLLDPPRLVICANGPPPTSATSPIGIPTAVLYHYARELALDEFEYPLIARGTLAASTSHGELPIEAWDY